VKGYFKRLLYDTDHKLEKEKQKEEGEIHSTQKEQRSAFSGLFNHNNLSKLTFTVPDVSLNEHEFAQKYRNNWHNNINFPPLVSCLVMIVP